MPNKKSPHTHPKTHAKSIRQDYLYLKSLIQESSPNKLPPSRGPAMGDDKEPPPPPDDGEVEGKDKERKHKSRHRDRDGVGRLF